jgi:hypothetical protein
MKSRLTHSLFGMLLLVGLLSVTSNSFARPPRQHAERGTIETVDHSANSFTLSSEKDTTKKTFIWKSGTSFRQKSPRPDASWITRLFSRGDKTTAESLQAGRSVRFYYRKEAGRYVVRDVTILAKVDQACPCCSRGTSATTPTEGLPL